MRKLRPEIAEAHREAVRRAEEFLLAHLDTPVPMSRLSGLVGLSERGLRNAFYSVRGASPKKWMAAQRLQGARHTLSGDWSETCTVTRVAATYGFYQLGRFAALYRRTFGEAPSDTLRSNRKSACAAHRPRTDQCFRQHAN